MNDAPGRLLGRERELAAAAEAIAAVKDGGSRVLAVLGETGIGKSALLDAVQSRAEEGGLLVLDGRAAEHERDVPFGLVIDALDDHVATLHPRRIESAGADLAAVLPAAAMAMDVRPAALGAGERFRCHRALRSLLEMLGREKPVALLLDDLHWADDASIELVLHLLRRPPRAPHLIVFALRPMDPAPRILHATRANADAVLLPLSPLPHAASLELIGHVADAGLRERLAREAAGNPLYLQELARVARDPGDPLPPTLLAAVRLEVAELPPASRALLDGAAVAGDPFDPELAAAAAALDPTDALSPLDRLVAADLVRASRGASSSAASSRRRASPWRPSRCSTPAVWATTPSRSGVRSDGSSASTSSSASRLSCRRPAFASASAIGPSSSARRARSEWGSSRAPAPYQRAAVAGAVVAAAVAASSSSAMDAPSPGRAHFSTWKARTAAPAPRAARAAATRSWAASRHAGGAAS